MADHQSYEESISKVYYGLKLLAIVTLVEVFISLFGKGHIVPAAKGWGTWFVAIIAILIIGLSLYKAYFIIYEFMHMKYEVKTLATTVLLPTALLIWAVIAFFQEGNAWKNRRIQIKEFNEQPAIQSSLELPDETYQIKNSDLG